MSKRLESDLPPDLTPDQQIVARQVTAARQLSFVSLIPGYERPEMAARNKEVLPAIYSAIKERVALLPGSVFLSSIIHTTVVAKAVGSSLKVYVGTQYANENVIYRYWQSDEDLVHYKARNNPLRITKGLQTAIPEEVLQPGRALTVLNFLSELMGDYPVVVPNSVVGEELPK